MSSMITAYFIRRVFSKSLNFHKNGGLETIPNFNKCFNTTSIIYQSSKHLKSSIINPRFKRYLKLLGIGCGIGTVVAGLQMLDVYRKVQTAIPNPKTSGEEYYLEELPPKQKLARSIRNPADGSGFKTTLYQFQTCPFCCKVRAFLDYYGFSYDVVEVNSVTHTQTKWTTYRKVPFIVIEQEGVEKVLQLKDSTMIISALQSFLSNKETTLEDLVKGYPIISSLDHDGKKRVDIMNRYSLLYGKEKPEIRKENFLREKQWRKWVDDVYVHMLSPNVYCTIEEAFQAFSWFSKVGNWEELFATWERLLVIYVGSVGMFLIGKRLKKRHNLKDDVRLSFYDETNVWLREVKQNGGKFHGGMEPDLSDLAVYGVLMAVEGCNAFQDLLAQTKVRSWFLDMKEAVDNHHGAKYLMERGSNRL